MEYIILISAIVCIGLYVRHMFHVAEQDDHALDTSRKYWERKHK